MAEKLQSLLDKINEKGVREAEAAASAILAVAEKEAAAIREQAKADARDTLKEAAEQATALEARAGAAIRQAARDIILELREELLRRLDHAVGDAAEKAMTPEFMASLIRELSTKFATNPNGQLSILTAVRDVPAFEAALRSALAASFRTSPEVFGDSGIRGGFEIGLKGEHTRYDFTVEAVTGLVADYVGPRLGTILKGE